MLRTPRNRRPPDRFGSWQKTPRPADRQSSLHNFRDTPIGELLLDFADSQPLSPDVTHPRTAHVQAPPFDLDDEDFPRLMTTPAVDENNNAPPPVQVDLQLPKTFSRGDFVFAKSGVRPHWPARVLSIVSEQKCQVFLYGLHLTVAALTRNIVPVTDESRKIYGKERRNDSHLKEVFSSALSEMDLSPELADPLLEVASAGLSAAQVHIQSQPLDPQNLQPRDLFIGTRTLHCIPKASRPQLAPALTQVIKDVLAYNDISSWKRLMQFAGICLQRPKRAGKKSKSPASVVNGQLKNFLLGLVPENQDYSANKPSELRKIVSAKLSDMDSQTA